MVSKKADGKANIGQTIKGIVLAITTVLCVVVGFVLEPFVGLEPTGMRFLAIFIWWIVLMITEFLPTHIATLIACVLCILLGVPDASTMVFSQMGSSVVMLIMGAFGFATGLINSGLLKRLSLLVVRAVRKTPLAQLMAFEAFNLAITPWIPAVNGKQAIMVPLGNDIAENLGFKPHTRAFTGFFMIANIFTLIIGMCFMTGAATVMTGLAFVPYEMTWLGYLRNTAVYLIVSVVLFSLFFMFYYRPAKGEAANVVDGEAITRNVNEQLAAMGKMGGKEIYALVVLVVTVLMFLVGDSLGISTMAVALGAWMLMCVGGLFSPQDFMTKLMWPVLVLIGGILGLVTLMQSTGVASWIAELCGPILAPLASNPLLLCFVLVLLVYALRFGLVSVTVTFALATAVFAGCNVDPFVYIFIILVSGMIFVLYYQNTMVIGALALTDGKVVQKDITVGAVVFTVVNLVAILASVPYWAALGMFG
ncbi:SLC13 family permease [Adlercreutzia sp. R21]|uniref:SLC13 family permease n=1 Tax=Adlercreutzia wanghongyangiae TaxID=3111451 RepID=UPI002DBF6463|nr:SLC13 family permease [Adlercreutzia sp. R21]MEC4183266.1 SLC13 family permease [Adlercreutzia sp. R21]